VEPAHRESAEITRRSIEQGLHDPATFRAALLRVPRSLRDDWCDLVVGMPELPDDSELPRGCVPYLPCSVDVLLRLPVGPSDVFVDIGSGPGRATTLVHLVTGATAIGVEIQPALVRVARQLAAHLPRVSCIEGDAAQLVGSITSGTVFFLYCPFGGDRLAGVLDDLESIDRPIRVCCLDLPLPSRPWLALDGEDGGLAIYRSTTAT